MASTSTVLGEPSRARLDPVDEGGTARPAERPQAARLRPRACAGSRAAGRRVSTTTRRTATGRPRAASAIHADSMSTAITPLSRQARAARPAPRILDRRGSARRALRPIRRSGSARSALSGHGLVFRPRSGARSRAPTSPGGARDRLAPHSARRRDRPKALRAIRRDPSSACAPAAHSPMRPTLMPGAREPRADGSRAPRCRSGARR